MSLIEEVGIEQSGFGYTGQQHDSSAGLVYLRARYYDPLTGRFISKDPFPGLPTLSQTQNPYPYTLNNPINHTDPSGHCPPSVCNPANGLQLDPYYSPQTWHRQRGEEYINGQWLYTGSFDTSLLSNKHQKLLFAGKALAYWQGKTNSLEAMARGTELLATFSGDNSDAFMAYASPVLSGRHAGEGIALYSGGRFGWYLQEIPPDRTYYADFLGSDGFNCTYRDPDITNNQVQHVWFELQLTYYTSFDVGFMANVWHEFLDRHAQGKSWQDFQAGLYALELAFKLQSNLLKPSQIGNDIRNHLGEGCIPSVCK